MPILDEHQECLDEEGSLWNVKTDNQIIGYVKVVGLVHMLQTDRVHSRANNLAYVLTV